MGGRDHDTVELLEGLVRGDKPPLRRLEPGTVLVRKYQGLLAPLAFVSPRIVSAIIDGTAPPDLTVTGRARALPFSWAERAKKVDFP
ncbi:MAG: hypothetical protein U1E60_23480 [Reyranellaceae bacterium]